MSHSLLWFVYVWGFCNHSKAEKLQYLLKIDTDRYHLRRFSAYKSFVSSMVFKNHQSGPLAPDHSVEMSVWVLVVESFLSVWKAECFGAYETSLALATILCGRLNAQWKVSIKCDPISQHGTFTRGFPWLQQLWHACWFHPKVSQSSHFPLSGLFSNKSNYGLKQRAHDVTVLFLAMVLGKKNLCLVGVN